MRPSRDALVRCLTALYQARAALFMRLKQAPTVRDHLRLSQLDNLIEETHRQAIYGAPGSSGSWL